MSTNGGGSTSLSAWWRNAAILVMIVGFSVLGYITVLTYTNAPPIPDRIVDETGAVLFTGDDVERGQEAFLRHALMEHGSLWGHGAYLGPDYTAEWIHRAAEIAREDLAHALYASSWADLDGDRAAAVDRAVREAFKANRYDPATGVLTFSPQQATAVGALESYWSEFFSRGDRAAGLPEAYITDPETIRTLNAYFAWASWAAVTPRPGKPYTYTNNWPYEPLVGNVPSTDAYVWSALSLVALLGGLGLTLLAFGRFHFLGWEGKPDEFEAVATTASAPALTPSQRATAKYFVVVAVLFLLQALAGGALAHYRVEPFSFYGFDAVVRLVPYNLLRTWHLQLAVFWIATAWVGGGLFLAPWVGGREPAGQARGVNALFWALVVVVLGSLGGEWLGVRGHLPTTWFWLGHQGSEYLDLGRAWQLLLAAGLGLWLVLMFRALRPAMRREGRSELSSLFLYAAVAIPVFYVPALLYGPRTNFTVIDNWRFWIIHLWVEGFFELFATVLVAIMFRHLGLVSTRTATRLVYLDAILFLGGGIIGTGHHWYFTGQGTANLALAACFSALEVVPLTLLTLDAAGFVHLSARNREVGGTDLASKHAWAIRFFVAVGVWNFVGAGVFGFLINLPIVSYYEIGTTLTANHGHAAMFGVFGMLGLGVLVFVMRSVQGDEAWAGTARWVRIGFWGVNGGLALMVVLDLFPAGVLQLRDVLANGYWHARRLTFALGGTYHRLEWARIVGDVTFLALGALPIAIAALRSYLRRDRL